MKALFLSGLALAIAAGFALPLAGSADAAMGGALPSTEVLPVENAQFFFGGQNYCWYDDGWQGPGWYWCGYAWNNGQGWGGGEGWHGWRGHSRGAHAGSGGNAPSGNVVHAPSGNVVHAPSGNVVHAHNFKSSSAPTSHVGVASHVRNVGNAGHAASGGNPPKKP